MRDIITENTEIMRVRHNLVDMPTNEDWNMICTLYAVDEETKVVQAKKLFDRGPEKKIFYGKWVSGNIVPIVGSLINLYRVSPGNNINGDSFLVFLASEIKLVKDLGLSGGIRLAQEVVYQGGSFPFAPTDILPLKPLEPEDNYYGSSPPFKSGKIYFAQRIGNAYYAFLPVHGSLAETLEASKTIGASTITFYLDVDGGGRVLDLRSTEEIVVPVGEDQEYEFIRAGSSYDPPVYPFLFTEGNQADYRCYMTVDGNWNLQEAENHGAWGYNIYQNYNPVTFEYSNPLASISNSKSKFYYYSADKRAFIKVETVGTGIPNKDSLVGSLDPYVANSAYGQLVEYGEGGTFSETVIGGGVDYATIKTPVGKSGLKIGDQVQFTNPNHTVTVTSIFYSIILGFSEIYFAPLGGGDSVIPFVTVASFPMKNRSSIHGPSTPQIVLTRWRLACGGQTYDSYIPGSGTMSSNYLDSDYYGLDSNPAELEGMAHIGINDSASEICVYITRFLGGVYGVIPGYGALAEYYTTDAVFVPTRNFWGGRIYCPKAASSWKWWDYNNLIWVNASPGDYLFPSFGPSFNVGDYWKSYRTSDYGYGYPISGDQYFRLK